MEKFTRLSQQQRTDLVAYLDGELDETATQEIEQVLVRSEVARHEVDVLARTWDLLDLLPRAKAPENFTHRTISRLQVVEQTQPVLAERSWYQSARRGAALAVWAAGLACSAYLGFAATHTWVPNEAQQLLQELPVIENFDKYTEVGNVEFLLQLKRNGTLKGHEETIGP